MLEMQWQLHCSLCRQPRQGALGKTQTAAADTPCPMPMWSPGRRFKLASAALPGVKPAQLRVLLLEVRLGAPLRRQSPHSQVEVGHTVS